VLPGAEAEASQAVASAVAFDEWLTSTKTKTKAFPSGWQFSFSLSLSFFSFYLVRKKILVIFAVNEKNRCVDNVALRGIGSLGAAMAKDSDAWRF
jgi:hypothetical protein